MNELLSQLNDVQVQAVTYGEGPMLILAGAGSGKTRVLTFRIAWLIEQGVAADSILAITFTNKAAQEMKTRVNELLGNMPYGQPMPKLGTFHALCVMILRKNSHHIEIPNNFSIYDETDTNSLIKQAMANLDIPTKKFNPTSVKSTISSAKNELVTAAQYANFAQGLYQETVAKIYPEYQRLLRANGALDFDDLMVEVLRLFEHTPEVLEYYQDLYKYVMVDEFQDTNKVQYQLTKLLAAKWKNINVVGDAAQSIYAFRGADLRNVRQFKSDYPDTNVFHLEQNYRSTKKILNAATLLIKPNKSAHDVLSLWTENEDGDNISLHEANGGDTEVGFVISQLRNMNQDGRKWSDVALLYRANSQSRAFEEGLIRSGVPYQIIGGVRFYDRREIKDLIAYLRLISNPKDTVSFERVVNVPPRKIGKVTLLQGGPALSQFYSLLDEFREKSQTMNILQLLDHVIERIAYQPYIHDGTEEGISRWENVQELRSVADTFSHAGPIQSLHSFLESISLLEQTDMAQDGEKTSVGKTVSGDRITLMTLHAAKGLEFPVVFMVGMEEGIFPHARSLDDRFSLEEERRLAYVGVTRAKEKLYLTYARSRVTFGNFSANVPSRFIKDLPMDMITFSADERTVKSFAPVRRRWDEFDDDSDSSNGKNLGYTPDPFNRWEF
ncbi:UvrD-helicase domain-containing protein [candidate division WWE3 bacterium]|nr:UvrD-helicase domain-containing protein [candidate division WWE3 bacterium]